MSRSNRTLARLRAKGLSPLLLVMLSCIGEGFSWTSMVRAEEMPERVDATRQEAKLRFSRGLELFNAGDLDGAYAEFIRAYEILPHPLVLYNLGLLQVSRGKTLDAVELLQKLIRDPGNLEKGRLSKARALLDSQLAELGELVLTSSVPGTIFEIDGVPSGVAPLGQPLRLVGGTHIVRASLEGYVTQQREVAIARRSTRTERFDLTFGNSQLGHLDIETATEGVRILVDGIFVGVTPSTRKIALVPGTRKIRLEKAGYLPVEADVEVGPGSVGELAFLARLDPSAAKGSIAFAVSEPDALVFVDGVRVAVGSEESIPLPEGSHRFRIERDGFYPYERSFLVVKNTEERRVAILEPTPSTRASYGASARGQRIGAWSLIGAGTLLTGGGAVGLGFLVDEEARARSIFSGEVAKNSPGGECDKTAGLQTTTCVASLTLANDSLATSSNNVTLGIVGVAAGAAVLGTGIVWLWLSPDPKRYELRPETNLLDTATLRPWFSPNVFGAEGGLQF